MRLGWRTMQAMLVVGLGLALGPAGRLAATPPETPATAKAAADSPVAEAEDKHEVVKMGPIRGYRLLDLDWDPGPLPGSKIAVLAGDPKTGPHHSYLKFADGSAIAPHWHSHDEFVTVVKGTILMGFGEKADREATRLFSPGGFVLIPARTPHYSFAKGEVILSLTRLGAADFHWVDPKDDPAKPKEAVAPARGQ